VEKTGQLPRVDNPTERMAAGKRFEEPIARWYSERTGAPVQWWDRTLAHPSRPWQVFSADAWVLKDGGAQIQDYGDIAARAVGGEDSKMVSWDQSDAWGIDGSDEVPERVAIQAQWSCSAADLPFWDIAGAFSMSELRIYRIHRDLELEAMLLEAVEYFWRHHVLARVPPRPGGSPATTEALRRLYPRNTQALRCATAEEYPLVEELKRAKAAKKKAEAECTAAENVIKAQIGEADGLLIGKDKLTFKRCADTVGVSWMEVAQELGLRLELLKPIVERALLDAMVKQSDAGQALIKLASESGDVAHAPDWWGQTLPQLAAQHQVVTKQGSRRLICPRAWAGEE
jgi:predicted phage-related endonuclease